MTRPKGCPRLHCRKNRPFLSKISPQRKQHVPFRAKLQNHMRTDIGGPDMVLGIDANHVRCYEQVVGNAAYEFDERVEFHEWMFAAMKNVNVPF